MAANDDTMTSARYLQIIKPVLEAMADRDYQERIWFHPTTDRWSPEELICTLRDDFSFGETMREPWLEISDAQRASWSRLNDLIGSFVRRHEGRFDSRAVFDDPEWDKIRAAAGALLKELFL